MPEGPAFMRAMKRRADRRFRFVDGGNEARSAERLICLLAQIWLPYVSILRRGFRKRHPTMPHRYFFRGFTQQIHKSRPSTL